MMDNLRAMIHSYLQLECDVISPTEKDIDNYIASGVNHYKTEERLHNSLEWYFGVGNKGECHQENCNRKVEALGDSKCYYHD